MALYIDASRANDVLQKTGVHAHARGMIEALMDVIPDHVKVVLLTQFPLDHSWKKLPTHWQHVQLSWRLPLWTTIRLSWFFLVHKKKNDVLYMPASQPPLIHPLLIATIHDIGWKIVPHAYTRFERIKQHICTYYICKNAVRILTPSHATKKDVETHYKAQNVSVIPNAVAPPDHIPIRQQTDNLLFIGRIETKKNVQCIVKAFALLKHDTLYTNTTLTLAGSSGWGSKEIDTMINTLPCKKDIHVIGYIDEQTKWKLLAQARIFLFPSLHEGFGIPIIEALQARAQIIASDICVHHEIAGDAIYYADPHNPEAWVKQIKAIWENTTHVDNMPSISYDWQKSAYLWWKKVSEVYNSF